VLRAGELPCPSLAVTDPRSVAPTSSATGTYVISVASAIVMQPSPCGSQRDQWNA
jgi:hypothetical protein